MCISKLAFENLWFLIPASSAFLHCKISYEGKSKKNLPLFRCARPRVGRPGAETLTLAAAPLHFAPSVAPLPEEPPEAREVSRTAAERPVPLPRGRRGRCGRPAPCGRSSAAAEFEGHGSGVAPAGSGGRAAGARVRVVRGALRGSAAAADTGRLRRRRSRPAGMALVVLAAVARLRRGLWPACDGDNGRCRGRWRTCAAL